MTAENARSVLSIVRSTLQRGCTDADEYLLVALGRVIADGALDSELKHEARRLLIEARSR